MQMNPNLILAAGQTADVFGSMERGNAFAMQQQQAERDNAFRQFTAENAQGILSGDGNALAGLAAFDPQMAINMQTQNRNNARADEQLAYNRQRDGVQDQRAEQTWQMKLDEYAAGKSKEEREAEAQQMTDVLSGAAHFYQQGDRDGYGRWLQQNGLDPAEYGFDDFPAHAELYGDAATRLRGGAEVGLQPIYGRDAEGNVVLMQAGKDGVAVRTQLPEGVTPDLGVASRERAAGTVTGKAEGEARIGLPGVRVEADKVIAQVDELINDPYLPEMLGPINSRKPNVSADAARVQSRMDQMRGQAFMQARQLLKGGGQITDYEGQRAELAMVRMNEAQGVEDYRAALNEFKDAIRVGVMKMEMAASNGQLPPDAGQPADPAAATDWTDAGNGVKIRVK